MVLRRVLMAAAAGVALAAMAVPAAARDVVIHAGRLIDGTGKAARDKVSIVIHDERITAVEDGFNARPRGAEGIEPSAATALAGLIDHPLPITQNLPQRHP